MRVACTCDIGHYRLLRWIVSTGSNMSRRNRTVQSSWVLKEIPESGFMNISVARYSLRIRWRHFTVFIALEPMKKNTKRKRMTTHFSLNIMTPSSREIRVQGCLRVKVEPSVHLKYISGCSVSTTTFFITCKNFRRSFAFSPRFLSLCYI
jgi:hypothetical protein